MSHRTGVALFKVGTGQARKTKNMKSDSGFALISSANLETEREESLNRASCPHHEVPIRRDADLGELGVGDTPCILSHFDAGHRALSDSALQASAL